MSTTVVGNVTRAPELRYTPAGKSKLTFGLAENRRYRDHRGDWQEQTTFHDVVVWGPLAENTAESIDRGTRVVVTGEYRQRDWETEAGDKRSKLELVADELGPALRWATAQVTKTERTTPNNTSTSSNRGGGRGGGRGGQPRQPNQPAGNGGYYDGEEPF